MTQEDIKEILEDKEADAAFAKYLGIDYEDYCELNYKSLNSDIDFDDYSK